MSSRTLAKLECSVGLVTGPVVTKHRRSWAGVSVVPAPDAQPSLLCPEMPGGWFYVPGAGGAVS